MKLYLLFLSCFTAFLAGAQGNPVMVVSSGHNKPTKSIDISPDNNFIVSGGGDNLVKVFNMRMQLELNTFSVHTDIVTQVAFSPSGNYIVSLSRSKLAIHTHPSGDYIETDFNFNKLSGVTFHITKDDKLLLGNYDGYQGKGVRKIDLKTGKIEKFYSQVQASEFIVLPDDRTLIYIPTTDAKNGLQFFDLQTEENKGYIQLEMPFFPHFSCSGDGKFLALIDNRKEIVLVDTDKREIVNKIIPFETGLYTACISPNAKKVYASCIDNAIRIIDTRTGKTLETIKDLSPGKGAYSVSQMAEDINFSDDGKIVAYGYSDLDGEGFKNRVEWFETKSHTSLGYHSGLTRLYGDLSIDPSGKTLSIGGMWSSKAGVKIFDIAKGAQKLFIPGHLNFSSSGSYMSTMNYRAKGDFHLEIYKMPAARKLKSFKLYGTAIPRISPSGRYVAALDYKTDEVNIKESKCYVRVWDLESEELLIEKAYDFMNYARGVQFAEDENKLILLFHSKMEVLDVSTGEIVGEFEEENVMFHNQLIPEDTALLTFNPASGVYTFNYETGRRNIILEEDSRRIPTAVTLSSDNSLLAVGSLRNDRKHPYQVLIYDSKSKELLCELIGHNIEIVKIAIGANNRYVFSLDANGVIAMWDLEECRLRSSFLSMGTEDYIITDPEGYYKSSKGNLENVGFRLKGQLFTFDQFDLRYNRPDKVIASIGMASQELVNLYHKAYKKRLSRMGFKEEDFSAKVNAPEIDIAAIESLPLVTTEKTIAINYKANDSEFNLDRLNISVNDVPIHGKLGKSLKEKSSKDFNGTIEISLVPGINKIQGSVMNAAGIESTRVTYTVECQTKQEKPNLMVIAYGVREYKDSTMNLTYSDKDANDLIEMMQKNTGADGKYNNVSVQLLTNGEVLKENITQARDLLLKTNTNDQVILFYSGHGLLNSDLDYFLSTHDVDFTDPTDRGLSFDEFKDLIDGIPARNRLLLVDACHSGEVDKEEVELVAEADIPEDVTVQTKGFAPKGKKVVGVGNTFELMKELFIELRKESGATIIASSSGKEYSLESDDWKNGVFTFALKEGLLQMKADEDQDGEVTVTELKRYLHDRVKELTDGKQTPTVRRENLQQDYVIY